MRRGLSVSLLFAAAVAAPLACVQPPGAPTSPLAIDRHWDPLYWRELVFGVLDHPPAAGALSLPRRQVMRLLYPEGDWPRIVLVENSLTRQHENLVRLVLDKAPGYLVQWLSSTGGGPSRYPASTRRSAPVLRSRHVNFTFYSVGGSGPRGDAPAVCRQPEILGCAAVGSDPGFVWLRADLPPDVFDVTLQHELGHAAGFHHTSSGLMSKTVRLPGGGLVRWDEKLTAHARMAYGRTCPGDRWSPSHGPDTYFRAPSSCGAGRGRIAAASRLFTHVRPILCGADHL